MVAYNLPGLAVTFGAKLFSQNLLSIVSQFSKDESETVRAKVAISFFEICKVYSEESHLKPLHNILFTLLEDDSS